MCIHHIFFCVKFITLIHIWKLYVPKSSLRISQLLSQAILAFCLISPQTCEVGILKKRFGGFVCVEVLRPNLPIEAHCFGREGFFSGPSQ